MTKKDVLEYAVQVVARWKACQYAYTAVRLNAARDEKFFIDPKDEELLLAKKKEKESLDELVVSTESISFDKIPWHGTGRELAELVLSLRRNGYISKENERDFYKVFEVNVKKETFYQYLEPTKSDAPGTSYGRIYSPRYRERFGDIKPTNSKSKS